MASEHKPHCSLRELIDRDRARVAVFYRRETDGKSEYAYADMDGIRSLFEQLQSAEEQRQFAVDRADVEMDRRRRMKEQLETVQRERDELQAGLLSGEVAVESALRERLALLDNALLEISRLAVDSRASIDTFDRIASIATLARGLDGS